MPKSKPKRKDQGSIPHWVWIFGIIVLAIIAGSFFGSDAPQKGTNSKSSGGQGQVKASKASSATAAAAKNMQSLKLLEQLSGQVSAMVSGGDLSPEVAKEYLEMLDLLISDIEGNDAIAAQLRDMASVVKGQLLAAGKGLSDKEVEEKYNVSTYSSVRFWEQHYGGASGEVATDWYVEWSRQLAGGATIRSLAEEAGLRPEHAILVLGCGNSPMSFEMYQDGYRRQQNIDVSSTVIDQMRQKYGANMPEASWHALDARNLVEFRDGQFDAVVDKGTFDAVSTDQSLAEDILREVGRVLRRGGPLLSIGSKRQLLFDGAAGFECRELELQDSESPHKESSEPAWMHSCKRVPST